MTMRIFLGALLLFLTSCSELKIIGNAAMKELKAEAISTEWLAYNTPEEPATTVEIARKDTRPSPPPWARVASAKSVRKGLWEHQ